MGVHQLGKLALDGFAALGIAQQQPVASELGGLLRTADDLGEKAVGDGGHQDHQVAGAPGAKLHGHQVGSVTGLFHGGVDLVAGVGEHPLRRPQGPGHRGNGNPGQPGYFADIGQDHLFIELCSGELSAGGPWSEIFLELIQGFDTSPASA